MLFSGNDHYAPNCWFLSSNLYAYVAQALYYDMKLRLNGNCQKMLEANLHIIGLQSLL